MLGRISRGTLFIVNVVFCREKEEGGKKEFGVKSDVKYFFL